MSGFLLLTIKHSTNHQAFHRVPSEIGTHCLADGTLSLGALSSSTLGQIGRERKNEEKKMGRYALLWLLGVPIPILLLIWLFGGLH
jgi:hypothetical protein